MRKTENIINRTGINKTECKKTGHSKENKIPGVKCTPKIELYLSNFRGALHWWNGSLFFLIIILGITLGIFAGCKNIFVPEPPATPEAAGPGGGLTVPLRLFTGSARSVMPGMKSLTWEITATSDGAEATVLGEYPDFKISFPSKGKWTIEVKGKSGTESGAKEIFTGEKTMEITGSTVSISIPLSPGSGMREGTGTIDLTMTVPTDVKEVKYKLDDESGFTDLPLIDGSCILKRTDVSAGIRTLSLYFLDGNGTTVYMCTETVNVWNGVTSNQWVNTSGADHINGNGEFELKKEIIDNFLKTMGFVVYVNASAADTPATGSFFAPVNSVSTAVDILRKANPGGKCNGTIMVSGETTIDREIEVLSGETLTIKGTGPDASIKNTSGGVFNIASDGSLTLGENITLTGTNATGNGGAVYVNGGTFTMENGSAITGGQAAYGGGVYVAGGNFIMEGNSIITESSATGTTASGGAVYVAGGTFTMNGTAILQGNTATTHGGGVHILSGGTFIMNGGTIDGTIGGTAGNTAENGGGVFVSGGTFNMYDGTISGNTVTESGGGVCISGGTFTMSDSAVISGNTATRSGGGVFVSGSGNFIMEGGTIGGTGGESHNSAENGGGVYIHNGAFTMSDGSISGNTATDNGGGVYVGDGTFTMSGGAVIRGNIASSSSGSGSGGGVFVQDGTFTLSGSPNISGNYRLAVDNINNVYLASGKTITIGAEGLTGGTIGVTVGKITAGDVVKITNENVSDADEIFTSDEARYAIVESSGAVYLSDAETKYVVTDGAEAFGAFTSALSAVNASGGTITLLKNIDGSNAVFGVGSVNNQPITFEGSSESISFILDLNGKTIDRKLSAAAIDGSVIKIEGGALTIKDSSAINLDGTGGTGTITGGNSSNTGGGVYVEKDCTFIMNGGIISKNTTGKNGGGVYVNAGTFTMDGGTITENTAAENGGGVSVVKDGVNRGKFTMNGGAISGNTATQNGGGVNIADIFTMNGGTISGNKAGENGGGVNIGGGNFTMIGGTISGNTATQNGGGVYATLADTVADTGYFWLGEEGKTSSPVISGNKKADGTHNNAYLFLDNRNRYMNINGPLQKTKSLGNVGISMDNPGRFTINWTKNSGLTNPDFFFSDKEGYGITGEGGELKMAPLSEIP